jgi:hypothetical protein
VRGNRAELGLLTAGGNDKLIIEEKRHAALALAPRCSL